MGTRIPILTYHRIDDDQLSTSTSPSIFARHLHWLAENGWRSLSSEEFAFYANRKNSMPSKSFLLTFDDGYESIASAALPVLKNLNFKSICFAATKQMRRSVNRTHSPKEAETAFLSWQQVRELQTGGFIEFQSHTHAHAQLSDQTSSQVASDLSCSLELLSGELGLPRSYFRHLAWPWGYSDEEARGIARKCGFIYQYTVARSAFLNTSSLQQIPRTCYDGATPVNFRTQFQLQSGALSRLWHVAYPVMRSIRHTPVRSLLRQTSMPTAATHESRASD
ncbi:polysaccharide deacetylase family protein [Noviherbaspirillum saxi]|uniref:NodB homology domain-containing protein n=1 Tax=Noviherbaspirillum saxi TaxID=2320863 RepID=A0A3A3G777_9BURK|nr:polysaccharide deacetylase family protein [Noviherbaspirillum saxi]RJF97995.1 hypothetical protein D3871_05300 [Noviherbaspirillum saxi]